MASSSTASKVSDFLKKKILIEHEIVTFRLLSRELSLHVNEAKNALAVFHQLSQSTPQAVYATYLLSGEMASDSPVSSQESNKSASYSMSRRKMMLVNQDEVENVKTLFISSPSVHVYSLSSTVLKDVVILTSCSAAIRTKDSVSGAEVTRKLGMTIAPDVKWSAGALKPTLKGKENATPKGSFVVSEKPNKSSSNVAAQTALSFKAQPISEQTGKDVKKTEVLKKSGTLDWSKAKAKATPTLPPQKEARSNQPIKEPKETYTGKEALKAGSKRTSPGTDIEDNSQERNVKSKTSHKSETSAPKPVLPPAARLKKGRVMSDEEEEEEEDVTPPSRKFISKKRKSTVIGSEEEEEEDDLQKPSKKPRATISRSIVMQRRQEASLRAMMQSDESEDEASSKNDLGDIDEDEEVPEERSEPEHVPLKKPKAAPKEKPKGIDVSQKPRKSKVVAPIGKNGKRMKRVTKTRSVEGKKKGYQVTEDYSSWEEDDGSDDEPVKEKKVKVTKAQSKAQSKEGTPVTKVKKEEDSEVSAPKVKPRPSTGKKPPVNRKDSSSLMSYFEKK